VSFEDVSYENDENKSQPLNKKCTVEIKTSH